MMKSTLPEIGPSGATAAPRREHTYRPKERKICDISSVSNGDAERVIMLQIVPSLL